MDILYLATRKGLKSMNLKLMIASTLCLTTIGFSSCTPEKDAPTLSKQSKSAPLSFRGLASNESVIDEVNKKIVSLDSSYKVVPLINELITLTEQKEQQDNTKLQLYKLILRPALKLDGLVWRFRNIVEESGALHLAALGTITKAFHRDYMYGSHVKAALEYITGPTTTGAPMFKNLGEAQDFLEKEIKPELERSLRELISLTEKLEDNWKLEFDAHLLTGVDASKNITFISEKQRFKTVIKPHLHYGVAALHRALGFVNIAINYNIDQLPTFIDKLVGKTAINNMGLSKTLTRGLPQITTPKEASEILNSGKILSNKKRFASFLTLRKTKEDSQENIKSAMRHFKSAAKSEKAGLLGTIDASDLNNGSRYIINPNFLEIGKESTVRRLEQMEDLYNSALQKKTKIVTSATTGAQTKVNLAALFTAHSDLKVFLPKPSDFENIKRGNR
jgi:hypothetical protein